MDKAFQQNLYSSLKDLHNWRIKSNGSEIGYGYDQYKKYEKYNYPEAYAFWGNGYLNIYRVTGEKYYLKLAVECSRWLLKNKSKQYKYYSWGLPWEWNKCSKETSYITTSTFVGNFLLSMYEETSVKRYLDASESIGEWILEENGYNMENDRIWFNYSDHPSLKYPIFNAISMASGFFSRLFHHNHHNKFEKISRDSALYVVEFQKKDGSWNYSDKSKIIDNVHTGFTIEGLLQSYQTACYGEKDIEISIKKAIEHYKTNLYTNTGFGYERQRNKIGDKIIIKLLPKKAESRLLGYASGIRAFVKYQNTFREENYGEVIARYVIKNLKTEEGFFKFTGSNNSSYIRNEAHIFDALSLLLFSKKLENTNSN